MSAYWPSLIGGMLIGLSAIMLFILNGRLVGISGIVGNLAQARHAPTNAAFVAGLILGPVLYLAAFGAYPIVTSPLRYR